MPSRVCKKYKKIIEGLPYFKSEKEALTHALNLMKKDFSDYQVWAKIEKDGKIFHIADWWIVTDDWRVKQTADYIGLALVYDNIRLQKIYYEIFR